MALYEFDGMCPALADDGSTWIAPSADVIGDVRIGREVGIWFGACIRADNTPIIIGDRSNVQDGAMLHSDPGAPLAIGDECTIGHHAILHGCSIGNRVLIGMGATILNHARIGDDCLIGAQALVTEGKMFASGSLIIGAPAKAVRTLSAEAITRLRESAADYAARRAEFAAGLKRL